MLRRLVFSLAAATLLASAHSASAQTQIVFDSLTSPATFSFAPTAPRSAIGQIFNLGNLTGTATPIQITGSDFAIASTAAATYTNVTVTQYFWATASGAISGSTAAYTALLGSRVYSLGAQTLTANTAYTFTGGAASFNTPVTLSGLTTAGQIGFSEVVMTDSGTGAGLVLNDSLLPAFTTFATGTPSIGTNGLVVNGLSGYYRNALGESNGNFVGSDARSLGSTNYYIAARLYARSGTVAVAAPEPTSLAALLATSAPLGLVTLRRSRRGRTSKN